ncbi:MAG TPA: hypothetical protein VMU11_03300, partial [Verrucomicrobiae bacterium]|nr:hypothetical protein [Verrucomicrobiae bacterium]
VNFQECGTGSQTNIPTGNLAPQLMAQSRGVGATDNMDVDFFRAWQDDQPIPPFDPSSPVANYAAMTNIAAYYPVDDTDMPIGTVMSLDTSTSVKAIPSARAYDPNFLGVVVNDPGVILSNGSFDGVRVATIGRVYAFASLENGDIHIGDVVTTASSTGMLMKATGTGPSLGRALQNLEGSSDTTGTILIQIQPSYYIPSQDGHLYTEDLTAHRYLQVGVDGVPQVGPSAIAQFQGTTNTYLQVNLQNSSTGTQASSDYVATADNGDDSNYYIDFGINGSGYNSPDFTINGPDDGYLYVNGGNLTLGTASSADVVFHTGGTLSENERMRITSEGFVGIGTASPVALLDVAGDAHVGGTLSVDNLTVGGSAACLSNGANCPVSTLASVTANGALTYTTLTLGGGFVAGSSTVTSTFTVLGNTNLQNVSTTNLDVNGTLTASDLLVAGQHVCLSDGTNCSAGEVTSASSSDSVSVGAETEVLAVTTTPRTSSEAVWISATAKVDNADSLSGSSFTLRVRRGESCASGVQVGVDRTVDVGASDSDTLSVSFVDLPQSASAVAYRLCALASGGTPTVQDRSMTAQLVNQGADLAEVYYSNDANLSPGDVVALDPATDGMVRRSASAYDSQAIGVISTQPGLVISESPKAGGQPVMVALSGRIPVNVTAENGAILPGDYLTASAIPGVAMKATRSGIVIGQALSGFDGDGTGQVMAFVKNMHGTGADVASLDAIGQQFTAGLSVTGTGLVANFVNASSASIGLISSDTFQASTATIGTLTADQINSPALDVIASGTQALSEQMAAQLGLLAEVTSTLADLQQRVSTLEDILGPLQQAMSTSSIAGLTFDDAGSVLFSQLVSFHSGIQLDQISPLGDLLSITGDVQFLGRTTFDKDSGGFAVVHTGQRLVHIPFDRVYQSKPVISATVAFDDPTFTTSTMDEYFDQDFRIVILNASTTGFDILFNKPVSRDVTLSWTAIAVKDAHVFESALTIDETPAPYVVVPPPVVPVTSTTDDSASSSPSATSTPDDVIAVPDASATPTEGDDANPPAEATAPTAPDATSPTPDVTIPATDSASASSDSAPASDPAPTPDPAPAPAPVSTDAP